MDIALKRLNRISDLVFAAAMTIMILLFQLPTEDDLSTKESFELYLGEAFPTLILNPLICRYQRNTSNSRGLEKILSAI